MEGKKLSQEDTTVRVEVFGHVLFVTAVGKDTLHIVLPPNVTVSISKDEEKGDINSPSTLMDTTAKRKRPPTSHDQGSIALVPTQSPVKRQRLSQEDESLDHDSSLVQWFPPELLQTIFEHLPIEDRLYKIPLVCRQWHFAMSDQAYWRSLFDRNFGVSAYLELSWHRRFAVAHRRLVAKGVESCWRESEEEEAYWVIQQGMNNKFKELIKRQKESDTTYPPHSFAVMFLMCAQEGNLAMIKEMMANPVTATGITARDTNDRTPLMWASISGNAALVEHLLGFKEIDPNAVTITKTTSLMYAAQLGHTGVVKALLAHSALVNMVNAKGNSALSCAATNGYFEIVQLLLAAGASATLKTNKGSTPFSLAAQNGHYSIVALMSQYGVSIDGKNHKGGTPLILAAYRGHLEVVKFLVEWGADVSKCTTSGDDALMWAARQGHVEIVKYLLSVGASCDRKNEYDRDALLIAEKWKHYRVVDAILTHLTNNNKNS